MIVLLFLSMNRMVEYPEKPEVCTILIVYFSWLIFSSSLNVIGGPEYGYSVQIFLLSSSISTLSRSERQLTWFFGSVMVSHTCCIGADILTLISFFLGSSRR